MPSSLPSYIVYTAYNKFRALQNTQNQQYSTECSTYQTKPDRENNDIFSGLSRQGDSDLTTLEIWMQHQIRSKMFTFPPIACQSEETNPA